MGMRRKGFCLRGLIQGVRFRRRLVACRRIGATDEYNQNGNDRQELFICTALVL